MAEVEERIIALILEQTGIKRKRVQLTSSLADDIGMDGDDAVEFFEKFGEEFHVELAVLHDHWHEHFYPEGYGGPPPGCLVVIGIGVLAGFLLHEAINRIPAWASTVVLVALFCWLYGKFFVDHWDTDKENPITVQDLVDAATSGKWVKPYWEPSAESFRTRQ